ncbi:MAG: phosphoribosyltransferase family protein [Micromonosporaceae bacterium]
MVRAGTETFADRETAGRALAEQVEVYLGRQEAPLRPPLVLALPRGGVPVGDEVARTIGAELDVVVARKIGMPGHPEFGIGAVTADGPPIFNQEVLRRVGLTGTDLADAVAAERAEARRRLRRYRGDRPPPEIADRIVIVVDDGLATGITAMAALRSVREEGPRNLAFGAPVCSPDATVSLTAEADAVICVLTPALFTAVGEFYEDFAQMTDEEVEAILARSAGTATGRRPR